MTQNNNKKIVILSGGTGTPKLLQGLQQIVPANRISIIGNTGDDDYFYGLYVSPDIDTLLYLYSKRLDLNKFWGVKNDSFRIMNILERDFNENTWFTLGDKDLAWHMLRTKLLGKGYTLTEITQIYCDKMGLSLEILPVSNDPIRTKMKTREGKLLSFQEYTVKYQEEPSIQEIIYEGAAKAKITPEVRKAITNAQGIIIGPSNPFTSINPMLTIPSFYSLIKQASCQKIGVSPICNTKAYSGPVIRLMRQLGYKNNTYEIANMYQELIQKFFICKEDKAILAELRKIGIQGIPTNLTLG
ncbi:MAG: 2-phospho-L-lactate transferase, partial [Thermotogota bacterium]|nr:2-phospho-L-lactate transferase [Thermotogota bacterium]